MDNITEVQNLIFEQDYSYWTRSVPMQHLTVHIALDEQVIYNVNFVTNAFYRTRRMGVSTTFQDHIGVS